MRIKVQSQTRRNGGRSPGAVVIGALEAAINASQPDRLVRSAVTLEGDLLRIKSFELNMASFERVFVIGGGKASAGMAAEMERILRDKVTAGVVNVPDYLAVSNLHRIRFNVATHPRPSRSGLIGVRMMLALAGTPTSRDLFICLLSGGGSALMPMPVKGVTLEDKERLAALLLNSGATIAEVNAVRKHLSAIKGGRLAKMLQPATVVSLIISDVVGDRLDTIASGPTSPDRTTYGGARAVLEKYGLWGSVPKSVRLTISRGQRGELDETPKPGDRVFRHVHNFVVGTNRRACSAASEYLVKTGFEPHLVEEIEGQAARIGESLAGRLVRTASRSARPTALVAGGETTVTVRGEGAGGRNQELVLAASRIVDGERGIWLASIATDGLDGPTDAAGAAADSATAERARALGLDIRESLDNNDSYSFFRKLGGLLFTGPTGTNVNDVFVGVAEGGPREKKKTRRQYA